MTPSDCIDHGRVSAQGYLNVWSPVTKASIGMHRVVLAAKLGVSVKDLVGVVKHSCDNKRCINPDHLSLGTQSENIKEAIARGLMKMPSGEDHACTKLTDAQVAYVITSPKGARALGRELGVSHSIVSRIRNGKGRASQRMG